MFTKRAKVFLSASAIGLILCSAAIQAKEAPKSTLEDSFLPNTAKGSQMNEMLQPGFLLQPKNGGGFNAVDVSATCADCYPKNIRGMKDNSKQSTERGIREGSSAQYVVGSNAVEVAGIDTEGLAVDLNDFIRVSGLYFKSNPELKGAFKATFTYFPGTPGKPFQLEVPAGMNNPAMGPTIKSLNASIAEGTKCNDKKACSVFAVMGFSYSNPDKANQKLDSEDFAKFIKTNSKTVDHTFFHTNLTYNKPVTVILYQGTNGFFIDKDMVEEDLKNNQN